MQTCRPRLPKNEYIAAKQAAFLSGVSVQEWIAQSIREKYLRDEVSQKLKDVDRTIGNPCLVKNSAKD